MSLHIGYIGLGALGSELAQRFLAQHVLHVWDLNPAACERLAHHGARVAATAAGLARQCDVILLCLPRSSDVQQALFGPDGVAAGLTSGKLVIDQTSGVPDATRAMADQLAQRGVCMMDAGVSASPHIVAAGGATLMIGGPDAVIERGLPVLRAITQNIHRCGPRVGDGQAMKMVNNALNGAVRIGTLEMTALGRKAGVSLALLTEVFNAGAAHNQTTDKMLPAIMAGRASTNFGLGLMLKDINQAVELGLALGVPLPCVTATRALLQIGLNTSGEQARLEDMIQVVETLSGTRLGGPAQPGISDPAAARALAVTLDAALAALCRAISHEGLALGRAYGLDMDTMAGVLRTASGWSRALWHVLDARSDISVARAESDDPATSPVTSHSSSHTAPHIAALRAALGLGIGHGLPLLIPAAAMPA